MMEILECRNTHLWSHNTVGRAILKRIEGGNCRLLPPFGALRDSLIQSPSPKISPPPFERDVSEGRRLRTPSKLDPSLCGEKKEEFR
ncbi:hypothetical protein CEXT_370151 [Caerostris extrusa]|uniref:Uncharacterized protein n=1 Tax=Caerostris extrusa TaxID=172846 RepID=A0AAV4NEV2_CAEEX|nr:hypothetical protein CEXT_370151 [Caerostris extrusa]